MPQGSSKASSFGIAVFSTCLFVALLVGLSQRDSQPPSLASGALRIAPADVPLNLVETPDGFLISANCGYAPHYLQAYNESRRQVSDRLELSSLWYGLDYEPQRKLILASAGTRSVFVIPWLQGKFGKPREIVLEECDLTAGIAAQDSTTAIVACNQNAKALRFDFLTGRVLARAQVGEYPYTVKALPDGRVVVSNWGQASVTVLRGSDLKTLNTIKVGSHPSDVLMLPRRGQLLVACSDSDAISVIDLRSLREVQRLDIRLPGSPLGGAQPDALAFDPESGRLQVALAALDAVAVFQVHEEKDRETRFLGLIPVGGYPTALLYSPGAHSLFIASGRNAVAGPSGPSRLSQPPLSAFRPYRSDSGSRLAYVGYLRGGAIEAIPDSSFGRLREQMASLAQLVYGARLGEPSPESRELIQYFSAKRNPSRPIRHVIYVIKENRTYDQLFGDMKEGNGDPDLVLFGEPVTPNQHALARKFVLFDNFYVDGDVSADGQLWSTAAGTTDYVQKIWPSWYSHRIFRFDFWGSGYHGDSRHDHPIGVPSSGFIWDRAQGAGVTYRIYGMWTEEDKERPGMSVAYVRGLKDHYDPRYNDEIGAVTDQKRIDEWEREFREFEKKGKLPQLIVMHLPNDHTVGTRPGKFTPRAMVADNDLALGRLVETVSHSRFWPHTAIFVVEDDAQDGPDHVDAHRSILLIISPYVRHGVVEHGHFSTVSVLKTMEQILGLDSLTYFDERAPSLLSLFQKEPALDTYTALRPRVPLNELNPASAPGANESASWDFSHADVAPEQALNRVIWQSVKGRHSEPPVPIFNVRSTTASNANIRHHH